MSNFGNSKSDRGWLCLSKPTEEHGRIGEGYDDVLGESYVWTADLQNGRSIQAGDVIAIWDGARLLGVSRIEGAIEEFDGLRVSYSCPQCDSADVRFRKSESPRCRCAKCFWVGDSPIQKTTPRKYRRAAYAAGWCELRRHVSAEECRSLAKRPKSQHSIRELDLNRLEVTLESEDGIVLEPFRRRNPTMNGGHVLRTVRTRKGQGPFRVRMLQKYSSTCAFTGSNHDSALEAAHLYRYADVGEHFEDGGLLLRSDIHKLFDRGLLAVNPKTHSIDLHPDLSHHPSYANLAGKPLQVKVPAGAKRWLALHWEEHRPSD